MNMNGQKHPLAEVFGYPVSDMSGIAARFRKNRLCPFNNNIPNCTKDKAVVRRIFEKCVKGTKSVVQRRKHEKGAMMENERNSKRLMLVFCRCFLALSLIPFGYFISAVIVALLGNDVEWMIIIAFYTITPIFGFIPPICLLIVAAKGESKRYAIGGSIILLVNMVLLAFEELLLRAFAC